MYPDLLLFAEQDGIALQVLYCAAATGARIHLLAGPKVARVRQSRLISSYRQIKLPQEGEDLSGLRRDIEASLHETGSGILLPGDEYAMRMAVQLAPSLSSPIFPCPDIETYRIFNHKWDFHCLCRSIGVSVPRTAYIGTKTALRADRLATEFGFPLVIKPSNQGNCTGVVIAGSEQEVVQAIIDDPEYQYDTLIAQEYVPGYDIDCSTFSIDGEVRAFAVQRWVDNEVVFVANRSLIDDIKRILAATRYTGVAHFDARLCAQTGVPRIIECNPRFWGSVNAARCCGLNFVEAGLKSASWISQQPQVLDEGHFLSWSVLARRLLRLDFSAFTSVPTLRGVWANLLDPVPTLLEAMHTHLNRRKV